MKAIQTKYILIGLAVLALMWWLWRWFQTKPQKQKTPVMGKRQSGLLNQLNNSMMAAENITTELAPGAEYWGGGSEQIETGADGSEQIGLGATYTQIDPAAANFTFNTSGNA